MARSYQRRCIVQSCRRMTLRYSLPTNEGQAFVWLQRSGNQDMEKIKQSNAKICPRHFNKQCRTEYGRKLLRRGALPSLFLPDYTPTGDFKDNFLYLAKSVATSTHSSETIKTILEMPLASSAVMHCPQGKLRIPEKTYGKRMDPILNAMVAKDCPVARTPEFSNKSLVVHSIEHHPIADNTEYTDIPFVVCDMNIKNDTSSSHKSLECRTCLQIITEDNNISLETELVSKITILEALEKLAAIQVLETDLLPQQICKACFNNLKLAINFRSQVISSDERLKGRFPQLTDPLLVKPPLCVIKTEDVNTLEDNINNALEDIGTIKVKMEIDEDIERFESNENAYNISDDNTFKTGVDPVEEPPLYNYLNKTKLYENRQIIDPPKESLEKLPPKEIVCPGRLSFIKQLEPADNSWLCPKCGTILKTKRNYQVHIKKMHGSMTTNPSIYLCPDCGRSIVGCRKNYTEHMRQVHGKNVPEPRKRNSLCRDCGRFISGSQQTFLAHWILHHSIKIS